MTLYILYTYYMYICTYYIHIRATNLVGCTLDPKTFLCCSGEPVVHLGKIICYSTHLNWFCIGLHHYTQSICQSSSNTYLPELY